jgi:hypothetical protein
MELSEQSIHDVIHPTAAFSEITGYGDSFTNSASPGLVDWTDSTLNPKNRIDSLDTPAEPLWRIDGCTAFGTQFYIVPLFLRDMPPMRVDLFIPEPSKIPPYLRSVLDIDVAFHTRGRNRIAQLGITKYLLRILHYWTSTLTERHRIYDDIPFGSRLVLRAIPLNVSEAVIAVAKTHSLETKLLSVPVLQKLWGPQVRLPPTIDINDLVYQSQIHDSVCLVSIYGKVWIFKALTSYPHYLYHELWRLLKIPPHPNVISRPALLVTKKCGFGGKTAVVGFTLEHHEHGSLRDLIPLLELRNQVSFQDKLKWGIQLSSALIHLRETTGTFYPDLRLDNLVLSEDQDIIMVDFEQRGVWCEFAAPEVNAIEYIRLVAVDEQVPLVVREKYSAILRKLLPGWEQIHNYDKYNGPLSSYNIPWECLTRAEQEACEVYMLGRVLWCIFEAKSAPQRAAVWLSYQWEPLVEFPTYEKTPKHVRDLIDRCTRGRVPTLGKLIVREGSRLVLRELEGTGFSTARQVQELSKKWWTEEIKKSEAWLEERVKGLKCGSWQGNYFNRPTLRQVHAELQALSDGTPIPA